MKKSMKRPPWACLARNLTGGEVMARIRAGDDIALLPVGSMEMHGPQLPLGTDTIVAEALCRMAAPAMRGTVFDTITYSWPGCTKYSVPTISMTMEMETRYTRMVCDQLARCGFRRIYVVQLHGPGLALMRLTREFFEETGVPLALYRPLSMADNGRAECVAAGVAWEASLCAAAAEFMGEPMHIRPEAWAPQVRPPMPGEAAAARVQATGAFVGALVSHPNQHGVFKERVDAEMGRALLERMAASIARSAAPMAEWRDAWAGRSVAGSYSED
jgi:creatinine amidohydrolase